MKAFIYSRFSCKNQQEISIEGQVRECRQYAENHGIEILGEYADRARSGRSENRSDFRRLMRDVEAHVVDVVLVWKLDRFFRNRAESALYRRQLENNGVQLISITEYIPEGSAGIITQGMIETVAEYFSAKLAEDVSRGMHETALLCQVCGPLPYGYKSGPDKKYHIDPPAAEVVQRIYEMYADGNGPLKIARALNRDGIRTAKGGQWTAQSFSVMLKNEKYIGIYKYDDVVIPGGVPRIIEDELFFAVQRRMKSLAHARTRDNEDVEYLLSGKLFCGECGSPMAGIHGTSKNKQKHYYYSCAGHRQHRGCSMPNVRKDAVEQTVLDATLDLLTNENIAALSKDLEKHSIEKSESRNLLKSLQAQLREVEKQRKNICNAIAAGIITESTKEMLEQAESDRAALIKQIDLAQAQAALTIKADQVACWLTKFRTDDHDPRHNKELFNALIHAVYLYSDHLKIFYNTDKYGAFSIPFDATKGLSKCSNTLTNGSPSPTCSNTVTIFYIADTFGLQVTRASHW